MVTKLLIFIFAVTMLIFGGLIYLFFREEVIFVSCVGSCFPAELPNYNDLISQDIFGYIFLYLLPDALWYSSLLLVDLLLRSDSWYSKVVTIVTMALPFIFELLQNVEIVHGTFDWFDILTYLLTLIIFLLCTKNFYFKD